MEQRARPHGVPTFGGVAGMVLWALCSSCSGESEVGFFAADVYEGEVLCGVDGRSCFDEAGVEASFEETAGFAFVTTETSQHHPDGLFVYFEVERSDGVLGRGELDIPLNEEGVVTFAYSEERAGETVFVAEYARGILEVPDEALGERCDCLDGRLELTFEDSTGAVVHLSRGRFGWGDRPCIPRARFTELPDELLVIPRSCATDGRIPGPVEPIARGPADDEAPSSSYAWERSATCGGTASACSGTGGGGCESGSGGCAGDTGSGGCGGDTGGGGCGGDTGGGGCGGDVGGAGCAGSSGGCRVGGRRPIGPRGPQQTGLLVGLALAWVVWPRRHRSRFTRR